MPQKRSYDHYRSLHHKSDRKLPLYLYLLATGVCVVMTLLIDY